jgi:Probable metallopeptidase family (DUF6775)
LPSKSSRRKSSKGRPIRSLSVVCESPANVSLARDAVSLLKERINPIRVKVQKECFSGEQVDLDGIATAFVKLRIVDPTNRDARAIDSFALRDFEKRTLCGISRARGVPYEAVGLMKLFQRLTSDVIDVPEKVSIILTDRLIMTWSDDDLRFHARVAVFGFPSIISTSGIVEAPARPREYYLAKQALGLQGIGGTESILAKQFEGRYIEPDDDRTNMILHGYLLQCLFYAHGIEPFCKDKDCVLFNAHWQEEMIHAQVESGKLCAEHGAMLDKIKDGLPVKWLS